MILLQIGKSLFDEAGSKIVQEIMDKAKSRQVKVHLPVDFVTADKFNEKASVGATDITKGIDDEWMVNSTRLYF